VNAGGVVVGTARRLVRVGGTDSTRTEWKAAYWSQGTGLRLVAGLDVLIDINDNGVGVGTLTTAEGVRSYQWNGFTTVELGAFNVTALSGNGTAVGYTTQDQPRRVDAVRATPGNVLPFPGFGGMPAGSYAADVQGDIVVGTVGMQWLEAFVWTPAAGAQRLFADDHESIASAVNASGTIVGWSGELRGAFRRAPGGQIEALQALPGAPTHWGRTCAWGVSNVGVAVGISDSPTGRRAVKWLQDGTLVELGAGYPRAINDAGLIAGNQQPFGGHVIVWLPDGRRFPLGGPDGTVGEPSDWLPGSAPGPPASSMSGPC
jgi:hypothetical protein